MPKKLRKSPECLNCHKPVGNNNYCPHCGQQNTTKNVPVKQFFEDFMGDFFTFDSKFFRSFKPLLFKPGFLTKEYIDGRRVSYILPLRLYIFVTIVFFSLITIQTKFFIDETDKEEIEKEGQTYIPIFEKALAEFDSIPSLQRRFIASDLGIDFRPRNRATVELRFKQKMEELFPDQYSNELFLRFIDKTKIKKKGSGNFGKSFSRRHIRSFTGDTLLAKAYSDTLSNYFRFEREYYNAEGPALAELKKRLYTRFELKKDQAEQIYMKLAIMYSLRRAEDSNMKMSFGDLYEELNVDTVNPSLFDQGIIRFQKKLEIAQKKGGDAFFKEMLDQIPTVMFLLLPIFALILKLLYVRRKIFYVNHLIFSLHIHSIFFLYLIPMILFSGWIVNLLAQIGCLVHGYLSMKSVYGQSHPKTILKMFLGSLIYFWCLVGGIVFTMVLSVITI